MFTDGQKHRVIISISLLIRWGTVLCAHVGSTNVMRVRGLLTIIEEILRTGPQCQCPCLSEGPSPSLSWSVVLLSTLCPTLGRSYWPWNTARIFSWVFISTTTCWPLTCLPPIICVVLLFPASQSLLLSPGKPTVQANVQCPQLGRGHQSVSHNSEQESLYLH